MSGDLKERTEGEGHDWQTAVVVSLTIALCPDLQCQPSEYRPCADCTAILDSAFPETCPDADCYACRRGAVRAET